MCDVLWIVFPEPTNYMEYSQKGVRIKVTSPYRQYFDWSDTSSESSQQNQLSPKNLQFQMKDI